MGSLSSRRYANMAPLKEYKPDVTKNTKQVHHTHHTSMNVTAACANGAIEPWSNYTFNYNLIAALQSC